MNSIELQNELRDCLIYDGKLYYPVQMDGFHGYAIVPVPAGTPSISWHGGKIPLTVWREVVSYFEWTQDQFKGESQVRLFYNSDTKQWKAWAFPQHVGIGLSTHEIANHADWNRQSEAIGEGFRVYGTVHHHCSASAFQSGTDRSDESAQNGLHITVGSLGSKEYTLDARVVINRAQNSNPDLSEWFELPQAVVDILPPQACGEILKAILKCPIKDAPFPEQWKTNTVKEEARYTHVVGGGTKQVFHYGTSGQGPGPMGQTSYPGVNSAASRSSYDGRVWNKETQQWEWPGDVDASEEEQFFLEIEQAANEWGLTRIQMDALLKKASEASNGPNYSASLSGPMTQEKMRIQNILELCDYYKFTPWKAWTYWKVIKDTNESAEATPKYTPYNID